jgi:hypothetical protein
MIQTQSNRVSSCFSRPRVFNAVLPKTLRYNFSLVFTVAVMALACSGTSIGQTSPSSLAGNADYSRIAAETSCTLYVAANGSTRNSGTTTSSPITVQQAAQVATAGDRVCLASGTYNIASTIQPTHSGNANAWITYTSYNGTVNLVWTGGGGQDMVHFYNATFPDGPGYLAFNGLVLNGSNKAANGFFCQNSAHLKFTYNTVENMGSAGIGSVKCDYLTSDHNSLFHNGYSGGWSSAISYNSTQWFDSYGGFHNFVTNNIVAGSYDSSSNHSDGNGIIMDLSNGTYTASTANTPSALIANNVVYGNGGRCIEDFTVTNIWVVNNTCYDNDLDLTEGTQGSITSNQSSTQHFVNNIVEAWHSQPAFKIEGSYTAGSITYSHNLIYGGTTSGVASSDFQTANPDFTSPPAYNATSGGQYANTMSPAALGTDLTLRSGSPAINAGIDPTTLTTNSSLKSDMSAYIYTDINGNARPKGGAFTLGAYQ